MRRANALQPFGDHLAGQFRPVAILAEVSEVKLPQPGWHDLLEQGGGVIVGKMAVPAHDALLQTPRPPQIVLQHLYIMIGFQKKDVGRPDALDDQFRHMAKVGEKADVAGASAQQKTDGVASVVRNRKGVDGDVANCKGIAGGEEAGVNPDVQLILDGFAGQAVAINGDLQF